MLIIYVKLLRNHPLILNGISFRIHDFSMISGPSIFIGMGGYGFFVGKKSQPPYRIRKKFTTPLSDQEKNRHPPIRG